MKVLFVIDSLQTGGAEKSIIEIARRFDRFTAVICVLYPADDLREECSEAGILIHSLNVKRKYGFLEAVEKLKSVVSLEKPDILHATLYRAEVASRMVARKMNIPLLCSFVNDSYSEERYNLLGITGRLKLNMVKWLDRITASKSDHFMSITHAIVPANCKALKIPQEKVSVIYRGRDLTRLAGNVNNDAVLKLNSVFPRPVFLSVARLLRRKGYTESISAFAQVVRKFPGATYLIAGEGHDRKLFEELIARLGLSRNVFLLGNRTDIAELLTFADYFVFPSYYEGQGGSLVEAMLFGKPIIASRIPVVEESVTDGISARLFTLKDTGDIVSKMLWMIDNPENARVLGTKAKETALSKFDIKRIARQHEDLYQDLIQSRKKSLA